ncbi:MAG: hypothetical protein A2Y74_04240 [Actinobacteria bacterium RBG_13_63_9]|nr:MAG: hypothetical protein A2Y74_04240 [Actinobacteria bacterium RBG_13_63_9]
MKTGKWAAVLSISTAALLMVGLSVGCGGGGDGGKKSAKSPDEYAGQVCDVLSKYNTELEAFAGDDMGSDDPSEMKDAASRMAAVFQGMADDMKKIDPPSDVEDWHNSVVEAFAQTSDVLGQMEKALDKPLDEAMQEISDLSRQYVEDSPLDSVAELPSEYKDAFWTNPKCPEMDILGN